MRILKKELCRLFNIRLLVILMLFSLIYISMFMSITKDQWLYSSSTLDVDFYRELVTEFGPELSISEWDEFMVKRQGLIDAFMDEVKKNPIMQKHGIDTYEKYQQEKNNSQSTDINDELYAEFERITFEYPITKTMYSKLQLMNFIVDKKENNSIFTDNDYADKIITYEMGQAYHERYKEYMTANSITLINRSVIITVGADFIHMILLVTVWCFVLILPYQINERLRNVRLVKLTTCAGRKCFNKQAIASILAGALIGVTFCSLYAFMLFKKGALDFLKCTIEDLWFDMTYQQYLILYMTFIIFISICAALLAYFIGRLSTNYITGIGISVPLVAAFCTGTNYLGMSPFEMGTNISGVLSVVKVCGIGLTFIVCAVAVMLMLHCDKGRDVL